MTDAAINCHNSSPSIQDPLISISSLDEVPAARPPRDVVFRALTCPVLCRSPRAPLVDAGPPRSSDVSSTKKSPGSPPAHRRPGPRPRAARARASGSARSPFSIKVFSVAWSRAPRP